ncbi:uncharacterized protein LOC111398016 [Olea europaea var. sylvestris]|uniref:uncharacterized protein LOC111398014 n=1 Tax=Olea europaea var. sylvestris TaxID=158386 RepID=UPI000C1CD24D|nr:uncharacterized protein LOC111398014 [Olea europaea var. sylvestris]XP_022880744.1 uncharacterized protein LOC111398016 [Olea europaea var. sylvestris]
MGECLEDPTEARRLRTRSTRYTLIDEVLYKRGHSVPLLRCLNEEEAQYALQDVHEGMCGNNSGGQSLAHMILRHGYFWPIMKKDALKFVKKCDKCQHLASLIRTSHANICIPHSIVTDNEKQFDNSRLLDFCKELSIRKHFSTPKNPQANGQLETINKTIKHTLKAKLDALKGDGSKNSQV